MADSLTVEAGKRPGQAMLQKAIQSIQLRTHIIFNDTAHNSELVVHQNIYQAFMVVVIKLLAYIKALRVEPAKRGQMLLSVIEKTVAATHRAIVARAMAARVLHPEATCKLRASHSRWLGLHACHAVLALRPAQYVDTTRALRLELNSKRYRSARAHLKGRAARAFIAASQSIASMQY